MSSRSENLAKVREVFNTKHLAAEQAAEARKAQLWSTLPGLRDIDRRLATSGPRLMAVALGKSSETVEDIHADSLKLQKKRAELLEAAGYPAGYTDPVYECAECRDSGYLDSGRMCSCMKAALTAAGFESLGVSRLMKTCSFENFSLEYYADDPKSYATMARNLALVREYAENFEPEKSPNLIFFGNTGVGKTHLSVAAAREIIGAGWDVVYSGAGGMISDFEASHFRNDDGTGSGYNTDRYFSCDLLIVDDLGCEVVNQYTLSWLYELINRRMNSNRPTIISTNFNQKELGSRYTDRIASRIFGEYMPLIFTGTDIRMKKLGM